MKKVAQFLAFFIIYISLTACEPVWVKFFNYEELKAEVMSVDLIYCDNPNYKYVFNKPHEVKPFDFSKMQVVESLPEQKMDEFFLHLSDFEIAKGGSYLTAPLGYCIRIIYKDGGFEVLSCQLNFSCGYYADGNVKRVMGSGVGWLFSNQFFETQIGRFEE